MGRNTLQTTTLFLGSERNDLINRKIFNISVVFHTNDHQLIYNVALKLVSGQSASVLHDHHKIVSENNITNLTYVGATYNSGDVTDVM